MELGVIGDALRGSSPDGISILTEAKPVAAACMGLATATPGRAGPGFGFGLVPAGASGGIAAAFGTSGMLVRTSLSTHFFAFLSTVISHLGGWRCHLTFP